MQPIVAQYKDYIVHNEAYDAALQLRFLWEHGHSPIHCFLRSSLRGRAARALFAWPELPAVRPTAATFARLHYDRKTAPYRPPAVTAPQPRPAQRPAGFGGAFFQHEPHLGGLPAAHHPAPCPGGLLEQPTDGTIMLDAKWKRPNGRHAENDLRQRFAYSHHFEATQVRLLYPQAGQEAAVEGEFTRPLFGRAARHRKPSGAGFLT